MRSVMRDGNENRVACLGMDESTIKTLLMHSLNYSD